MKNKVKIAFLFLLSLPIFSNDVEWEKVNNADYYQIEVMDSFGKVIQKFGTKQTKTKIEIEKTGKYKYRIGSADKNKRVSWTNWIDFKVQNFIEEPKDKIILEWEKLKLADAYQVEVFDDYGNMVHTERLTTNKLGLKLGVGKYKYRVASINELGDKAWTNWERFEVKIKKYDVPYPLNEPKLAENSELIEKIEECDLRCNVIKRSFAIPGWGQYYRKDANWRVFAYPLLMSSLLFTYYQGHQTNQENAKKYDSALNTMLLTQADSSSGSSLLTYYSYTELTNASNATKHTYSQGNTTIILFVGIYLFNLVDAFFFTIIIRKFRKISLKRLLLFI
ncbi:MAG: hypothetical protein IPL26_21035 [Leptospiraceae bacterium]|nr:hypothetical protein [Leptospiraceae bacterium]